MQIILSRGGIPVLDLDGETIGRSYVAAQAHSVPVIA
jgi:hypothetical protein